ncbi:MAG: hypothetical protein J5674_05190, partial [Candidatus Methanomethylophilaceae archaeon]|nr:hypothetical protein [Candidatus Methanomethylophilaceae archaeon]
LIISSKNQDENKIPQQDDRDGKSARPAHGIPRRNSLTARSHPGACFYIPWPSAASAPKIYL